jgi:hypothetical protein
MADRAKVQLRTGRIIHLRELRQYEVYEGLLEGLPTAEMNERRIELLEARCRGEFYGADPVVIRPTEKPVEWNREEPYPFGRPAMLPGIACVGRFSCSEPARDSSKDYSGLVVIWFQDEFAFPIDPSVMGSLRELAWELDAVDLEH